VKAVEVANNILFSVMMFNGAQTVIQKISWLRTAIAFLKGYMETTGATKKELEEVEKLKERVDEIAMSVNWDVYAQYARGDFTLLSDDEYKEIQKALLVLEDIKEQIVVEMLRVGLAQGRMGVVKISDYVDALIKERK